MILYLENSFKLDLEKFIIQETSVGSKVVFEENNFDSGRLVDLTKFVNDKFIFSTTKGANVVTEARISNWRQAIFFAIKILAQEFYSCNSMIVPKVNACYIAAFLAGFSSDDVNYIASDRVNTDYLIDNLNLCTNLNLTFKERNDYSLAPFENIVMFKLNELKDIDLVLCNILVDKAGNEAKLNPYLKKFKNNRNKLERMRLFEKRLVDAVIDLRKLGYVAHPNAEKFSSAQKVYWGLNHREIIDINDFFISPNKKKNYHILPCNFLSSRKSLEEISIDDITIDVDCFIPYDKVVFCEDNKIVIIYEVIEQTSDKIRLYLNDSKKIDIEKYLINKNIDFSTQQTIKTEIATGLANHLSRNMYEKS